ncbi:MAG: glycosyltransferase family 61 protein [Caulobacteraceae bacterium]
MWLPRFGLLMDDQGRAPASPIGEVRHDWPMLDPVPGVSHDDGALSFTPPQEVGQLGVSTVALPWGMSNYGHFLLDGLPAILAVEETGLLADAPLTVPTLNRWQRALISTAFGALPLREVRAPAVRLEGVVFSTAMDHFLHTPGPLTLRLRDRLRDRLPPPSRKDRRLYISRRSQHMRIMVDEAALEATLAARGFEIIRPERLSVVDQLTLFGEASVVVGASGAGLSNLLLCHAGAKIVEIQPENFTSFWIGAVCLAAGLDWRCYVCHSPGPSVEAPWLSRVRRGFRFAYQLDVPAFTAFLDACLHD